MPIVGYQPSGLPKNWRRALLVERLGEYGIVTLGDLDRWRARQGLSRYRALCRIVGEDAAIGILNELAIYKCNKVAQGARRANV